MGIHTSFPQHSTNVYRGDWNFWDELGADVDGVKTINALKDDLYTAPTARIVEEGMLVNRYGKDVENPEGRIGFRAANRVLGRRPEEGDELVVRMFPHGEWPDETYDAVLEVVDADEERYAEEVRELYDTGYLLLEEVPDGFERGLYDFYVLSDTGEYALMDSSAAVDLDEWA